VKPGYVNNRRAGRSVFRFFVRSHCERCLLQLSTYNGIADRFVG